MTLNIDNHPTPFSRSLGLIDTAQLECLTQAERLRECGFFIAAQALTNTVAVLYTYRRKIEQYEFESSSLKFWEEHTTVTNLVYGLTGINPLEVVESHGNVQV